MADLQIRDVPQDVLDILARRAKDRAQSLNAYLRGILLREAYFANNSALIDHVVASRSESKFTAEDVLAERDDIRALRGLAD